jgi:hypothetical protein
MEAVRVTCGSDWAYVPTIGRKYEVLCKLASEGLAEATASGVRLKHETGPLAWSVMGRPRENRPLPQVMRSLSENGMDISPDERLCFGKASDGEYNEYADVSLVRRKERGGGVKLSAGRMSEGDMVLCAWPRSLRLIPGMAKAEGRRLSVTLVDGAPRGERCFVVDEEGKRLLTVSLASDGSDTVKVMPPLAVDSWLFSVGSKAARDLNSRFEVEEEDGSFLISDKKTGRRYAGRLQSQSDPDRLEVERERLQWLLATSGLGGVLPIYALEKA